MVSLWARDAGQAREIAERRQNARYLPGITLPALEATADHGEVTGNTIAGTYAQARAELDAVAKLGISYDDVVQLLEDEGVEKFEASWIELLDGVQKSLDAAAAGSSSPSDAA